MLLSCPPDGDYNICIIIIKNLPIVSTSATALMFIIAHHRSGYMHLWSLKGVLGTIIVSSFGVLQPRPGELSSSTQQTHGRDKGVYLYPNNNPV